MVVITTVQLVDTIITIQDIEIVKWHSLYSYDPISDEEMPLEYENDSGIRIEGRIERLAYRNDTLNYLKLVIAILVLILIIK